MLIVLACAAVAAAIGITADWVEQGDSSCGPLYRPEYWTDSSYCEQLMTSRLIAVVALLLTAAFAVALHVLRGRPYN